MRKALLFLTFCMSLLACGNVYAQNNKAVAADNSKNRIESCIFTADSVVPLVWR